MKKFLLLILIICSFDLFAENLDKKVENLFKEEINFVVKDDYKGFVSNGTAEFKKVITPKMFSDVSKQVLERFKIGHEEVFLTTLRKGGHFVYLWKISFKDNGDDIIAKMVLEKGDKISGFWLQ